MKIIELDDFETVSKTSSFSSFSLEGEIIEIKGEKYKLAKITNTE